MKKTPLFLVVTAITLGLGFFTACNNQPKNEQPKDDTPTEQELLCLGDFPDTDLHLSVTVSDDFTTAVISRDGKEVQTVYEEYGLASDEALVRYLDANFDGYTDIYIGPGVSRTSNALLIWSEKEQQFVSVHNGTALQNPMLDPETKSFFDAGSNSASEFGISRSIFNGDQLIMQEELSIVMPPEEYMNNHVKHKYTLKDTDNQVLCSTETADGLPKLWQKMVEAYGY